MTQPDLQKARKLYAMADPSRGASPEESHTAWIKLHSFIQARGGSLDEVTGNGHHHSPPPPPPPPPPQKPDWRQVFGTIGSTLWVRYETKRLTHAGWAWLAFASDSQIAEWERAGQNIAELRLSGKQKSALHNLGVNLDTLTSGQLGARLLSVLIARARNGMATVAQVCCLYERGHELEDAAGMTFQEATEAMQN